MNVSFFFLDCELGDLKDVSDDVKENKNAQTETSKKASEKYEKIWELIFWKLTKYWLKVLKVKGFRVWAVSCLISVFSALAAPVALCKLQIQKRRWKPETVFHIVGFSLCSTCSLLCKLLDEWRLGDPPRAHASNLWNFFTGLFCASLWLCSSFGFFGYRGNLRALFIFMCLP